jgi:hypothetical protein
MRRHTCRDPHSCSSSVHRDDDRREDACEACQRNPADEETPLGILCKECAKSLELELKELKDKEEYDS